NPMVSGKGIRALRKAGCHVVLMPKNEAQLLNQAFAKSLESNLPYLTLKLAMTFDGKMATDSGNSKWITNEESRLLVHRLRAKANAIAVGRKTVEKDCPRLTIRLNGKEKRAKLIVFGIPSNLKSWLKKRRLGAEDLILVSKNPPRNLGASW